MSSNPAKDFEKYARECVKLAEQSNTPPESRKHLNDFCVYAVS